MPIDSSTLISITNTIDPALIRDIDINSSEFRNFMVSLIENINSISLAVNEKDIGIYSEYEIITGQKYFPVSRKIERATKRKVIDFGALPNTTTKSVAHGLDTTWGYIFTRIYAVASDTTGLTRLPIPYASSTAADIIELWADGTNINIKTGKDQTAFDTTYVVIEYLT